MTLPPMTLAAKKKMERWMDGWIDDYCGTTKCVHVAPITQEDRSTATYI